MYYMPPIKSYEPCVNSCISLLLERFDGFAAIGEVFDLQLGMHCYAFDVIGESTAGRQQAFDKRIGFLESGGEEIDGIMRALEDSHASSAIAGLHSALVPVLFALYGNLAGGSDTASITLTSTLYHALTTKGVSQRPNEEICPNGAVSQIDKRITFDEAQKLPHLQMVVNEALRVCPAVGLPMWREVADSGLTVDEPPFHQG